MKNINYKKLIRVIVWIILYEVFLGHYIKWLGKYSLTFCENYAIFF